LCLLSNQKTKEGDRTHISRRNPRRPKKEPSQIATQLAFLASTLDAGATNKATNHGVILKPGGFGLRTSFVRAIPPHHPQLTPNKGERGGTCYSTDTQNGFIAMLTHRVLMQTPPTDSTPERSAPCSISGSAPSIF
jgi:hypothetical protein